MLQHRRDLRRRPSDLAVRLEVTELAGVRELALLRRRRDGLDGWVLRDEPPVLLR